MILFIFMHETGKNGLFYIKNNPLSVLLIYFFFEYAARRK